MTSASSLEVLLLPCVCYSGCDGIMQVWAVVPNLNILDNSILIVDNKYLFAYLGWLGNSTVIHKKPPNFEVSRS